jgi:hypothetical protein
MLVLQKFPCSAYMIISAASVYEVKRHVFFQETYFDCYVKLIPTPLFQELKKGKCRAIHFEEKLSKINC